MRRGHSFSLGLHTLVFQTEIYTIKVFLMEKDEKCYTGRNIYIISDSQAAIKALDSFQIDSKLVWDCDQSLVKLVEHNRIQLVWVPGHMGTDGNETADELAKESSSHPLKDPEPVLGISADNGRRVIMD